MKNIYAFLILILSMSLSNAQFNEYFDDSLEIPAGWKVINGGDANTWVVSNQPVGDGAPSGTNYLSITYSSQAHDDYIITPAITVEKGKNNIIRFMIKSRSYAYLEPYEIRVSTTTNEDAANFSTVLQAEEYAPRKWTEKSFDLSTFEGQTIYFAIRATGKDKDHLYVDSFVNEGSSVSTDELDFNSLHSPKEGEIILGESFEVTGHAQKTGVTEAEGQAEGIQAWVGYSKSNTNPKDWTNWVTANYIKDESGKDVYKADIGSKINSTGNYYYVYRFRYNSGPYTYGGYSSTGGGTWDGSSNVSGTLVVNPPQAPANDECSGAYTLTVNPDRNCTSVTSGTLQSATASNVDPSACPGSENNDVWFSFVATQNSHSFSLTNIANGDHDLYYSIWSGDCNNLSLVPDSCEDVESEKVKSGFNEGETYFIRVYSYQPTSTSTTFDVCVGTPPAPPANDDCSGAVELIVGNNFEANAVVGTNVAATTQSGMPDFGCVPSGYGGGDIWYTFIVPEDGKVTLETKAQAGSNLDDTVIEVLSGSCSNLVAVKCDSDGGEGSFSKITLTDRTAGEKLYLRVIEFGNDEYGEFRISAYNESMSIENQDITNDVLDIIPNPVNDVLTIKTNLNIDKLEIYSINGSLIMSQKHNNNSINVYGLTKGLYILKTISEEGKILYKKFIKK